MTTFERFRRDIKSRSNSQLKNSTGQGQIRQKEQNIKLIFSSDQIKFINNQHNNSIYRLNIINKTGYKIHFKIRCNNAKNYIVIPFQEVIANFNNIQIQFQIDFNHVNPNNVAKDKFQIMWGKVPYRPGQPTALTQSKIFPVKIQQTYSGNLFQGITNINYRSSTNPNQQNQLNKLTVQGSKFRKSAVSFSNENASSLNTLLTKTNLIAISIISFILGFLFT